MAHKLTIAENIEIIGLVGNNSCLEREAVPLHTLLC